MRSKLAALQSFGLLGIRGYPVRVEVEVSNGLPAFRVVGLPDATVTESRERVRCALQASDYRFPQQRITVNLAPADIRKEGPIFDLPIALGLISALDALPASSLASLGVVGELSLDGHVRPIRGALSLAMEARQQGLKGLLLPADNAAEAGLVDGIELWPVRTLREAVAALQSGRQPTAQDPSTPLLTVGDELPDLSDVRGHGQIRRALEIAAAGGHNLLFIGPPGSGKTMLAHRLPGILPPLQRDEALEVMQVHSAAGRGPAVVTALTRRPFRAPHHTASPGGIVGGGSIPRPGEISLAHGGVLFLDELPEFPRSVLEVLREPLESRQVTLARASTTVTFPADFIFVACMNPCPCGFDHDAMQSCRCPRTLRNRYRSRISGPLLDRIDLILEVPREHSQEAGEASGPVLQRVLAARTVQQLRLAGSPAHSNARMSLAQMRLYCALPPDLAASLQAIARVRCLSARATDRILRVARTIADLAAADHIETLHLLEAVQMRSGQDLLSAV